MKHSPLLLLATSLLVPPAPARADKDLVYAIVGARIAPVSGPVREQATIVLRDGVIEALGEGVSAPADARVIDGSGLTLTPGLIDGFGELGLPKPKRGGKSSWPARRDLTPAGARTRESGSGHGPRGARQRHHDRTRDQWRGRTAGPQRASSTCPARRPKAWCCVQPAALHLHMATLSDATPTR